MNTLTPIGLEWNWNGIRSNEDCYDDAAIYFAWQDTRAYRKRYTYARNNGLAVMNPCSIQDLRTQANKNWNGTVTNWGDQ